MPSSLQTEIEFAGDGSPTHDGKGRHNAESNAVKGDGVEFSYPTQDLDLHLSSSQILTCACPVRKSQDLSPSLPTCPPAPSGLPLFPEAHCCTRLI